MSDKTEKMNVQIDPKLNKFFRENSAIRVKTVRLDGVITIDKFRKYLGDSSWITPPRFEVDIVFKGNVIMYNRLIPVNSGEIVHRRTNKYIRYQCTAEVSRYLRYIDSDVKSVQIKKITLQNE